MTILFVVVPLAILLAIGFLVGFMWCVRSGQFDDVDTPALRMLDKSDEGASTRSASASGGSSRQTV